MQSGIAKAFELRERIKAASSELLRRKASSSLLEFTKYTFGDGYNINWHHVLICQEIENWINSPEPYNLMIRVPPRHGKSEICSRHLPPYLFGKFPDAQILAASYAASLAKDMSSDAQKVMVHETYRNVFPETSLVTKGMKFDENAIRRAEEFTIQGKRGHYLCAGVDGGFTGHGADFGIIDDPVKGRKEAESKTIRESTVEWYKSDFRSRLENGGRILLLMTPWHIDDLGGWIIKKLKDDPLFDNWKIISFPALFEQSEFTHPGDLRKEGEPLWPWKFDLKALAALQSTIGSYSWNGLYQLRPSPPGGALIKRYWLNIISRTELPLNLEWVRGWDLAVSKKTSADYTASGQMAVDLDGNIYVRDFFREQLEWPTIRRVFVKKAREEQVPISFETSGTQKGFFDDLISLPELRDIPIYGNSPDKDKMTRALPWIARAEAGKFFIVDGPGVDKYIDELVEFTGVDDTHDDQVDWTSGAYQMLAGDTEPELEVIGQYEVG